MKYPVGSLIRGIDSVLETSVFDASGRWLGCLSRDMIALVIECGSPPNFSTNSYMKIYFSDKTGWVHCGRVDGVLWT